MTLLTGGGRGAGLCGVGRGQARSAGGPAEGQRCQSWAPAHFPCPGETAADSGGHRLPQDCGEQKQLPLVKITTSRFPCQHQPLLRHSHDRPRTTPGSGEPPASGTEPRCQVSNARDIRDMGLIPGLGRSPGEGHGNPLQYSCLKNLMDRGAWRVTVHSVTKSWT